MIGSELLSNSRNRPSQSFRHALYFPHCKFFFDGKRNSFLRSEMPLILHRFRLVTRVFILYHHTRPTGFGPKLIGFDRFGSEEGRQTFYVPLIGEEMSPLWRDDSSFNMREMTWASSDNEGPDFWLRTPRFGQTELSSNRDPHISVFFLVSLIHFLGWRRVIRFFGASRFVLGLRSLSPSHYSDRELSTAPPMKFTIGKIMLVTRPQTDRNQNHHELKRSIIICVSILKIHIKIF